MTEQEQIKAAMATRDLMSAVKTLLEMSPEVVRQEWLDLEIVEEQLNLLLESIYDRDTVRKLRQRAYGYAQATPRQMVVREVSSPGKP